MAVVPGRHLNWPAIKQSYVEGILNEESGKREWLPLDRVAELHECNSANLRRRASDEHWVEERTAFQRRIEDARQAETARSTAASAAELDSAALAISRSGLAVVAGRMGELVAVAKSRTEGEQGRDSVRLDPFVDPVELSALGRTAQQFYALGRAAVGDVPNIVHTHVGDPDRPIGVEARGDDRTASILAILIDAGALSTAGAAAPYGSNGFGLSLVGREPDAIDVGDDADDLEVDPPPAD